MGAMDNTSGNSGDAKQNMSRSAIRRQRERENRYQSILKSAETLFAKEGYNGASMEKIADMSEMSVGAVYFYFKNKEDLLVQLIDEISYLLRRILGKAFKEHGSTMEGFKRAGYAFFEEFCMKHPEKAAILLRESVGNSPAVEARRKEIFDTITADLTDALVKAAESRKNHFKSPFSVEIIIVSILGIYERVAYQYMFWQDMSKDLKPIGRDAVDFILGGIENLFTES